MKRKQLLYLIVPAILGVLVAWKGNQEKEVSAIKPATKSEHNVVVAENGANYMDESAISIDSKLLTPQELARKTGQQNDPEAIEEYGKRTHFQIKLENPTVQDLMKYNAGTEQNYYNRINYYSVAAKEDIWVVIGEDTVECSDIHFERNYGVAPQIILSVIFPKIPDNENFTLMFFDRVFGAGLNEFQYQQKQS